MMHLLFAATALLLVHVGVAQAQVCTKNIPGLQLAALADTPKFADKMSSGPFGITVNTPSDSKFTLAMELLDEVDDSRLSPIPEASISAGATGEWSLDADANFVLDITTFGDGAAPIDDGTGDPTIFEGADPNGGGAGDGSSSAARAAVNQFVSLLLFSSVTLALTLGSLGMTSLSRTALLCVVVVVAAAVTQSAVEPATASTPCVNTIILRVNPHFIGDMPVTLTGGTVMNEIKCPATKELKWSTFPGNYKFFPGQGCVWHSVFKRLSTPTDATQPAACGVVGPAKLTVISTGNNALQIVGFANKDPVRARSVAPGVALSEWSTDVGVQGFKLAPLDLSSRVTGAGADTWTARLLPSSVYSLNFASVPVMVENADASITCLFAYGCESGACSKPTKSQFSISSAAGTCSIRSFGLRTRGGNCTQTLDTTTMCETLGCDACCVDAACTSSTACIYDDSNVSKFGADRCQCPPPPCSGPNCRTGIMNGSADMNAPVALLTVLSMMLSSLLVCHLG